MKSLLCTLLGLSAGIALALVLVIIVELLSAVVHPVPPGFTGTMDEMCQHVTRYPHWVLGAVVIMWCATGYISTWVAAKIGNRPAGIAVALLLMFALVFNIISLPYTVWFKVVMLASFPVACYLAITRTARTVSPVAAANVE